MKKLNLKITTAVTFSGLIFLIISTFFVSGCRKSEPQKSAWTSVKTFAGLNEKFGEPFGLAMDKSGVLYVADGETGKIWRVSKDGSMQIFSDKPDTPSQIAFDKNGDLIVADSGRHTIMKIKQNGESELIAGVENQSGFADGEAKTALFNAPVGLAVFEDKIFVADTYNDRIRLIENGAVSTVAGSLQGFNNGNGAEAKFDTPTSLAVWKDGKILVADSGNRRIRVIEPDSEVSTLAGNGNSNLKDGFLFDAEFVQPGAISVDEFGAIYIADGNAVRVIGRRFYPLVETVSSDRRGFSDGDLRQAKLNRPSGLAVDASGNLFVADSENQVIRIFSGEDLGKEISEEEKKNLRFTAEEFRQLQLPRWCYDPPEKARDIAGTLGEIRGEINETDNPVWFHNGLDIAGAYGETAQFIRTEKVLRPVAVENFATRRELIRMPTLGYIHLRLGRDAGDKIFEDERFQFSFDAQKKPNGLRVPRGAKFEAGEQLGTLNAMNHVHLIAGRSGAEMNAIDALILPNLGDSKMPTIEKVTLFDENWREIETPNANERIKLDGKTRIVVRAFDQMDGNAAYRKLGVYRLGFQILKNDAPVSDENWTIRFDRMPAEDTVRLVYAKGSVSGYAPQTVFNYIVSNEVNEEIARENFLDAGSLEAGEYTLRVFAADFFGNVASKDLNFEIIR